MLDFIVYSVIGILFLVCLTSLVSRIAFSIYFEEKLKFEEKLQEVKDGRIIKR